MISLVSVDIASSEVLPMSMRGATVSSANRTVSTTHAYWHNTGGGEHTKESGVAIGRLLQYDNVTPRPLGGADLRWRGHHTCLYTHTHTRTGPPGCRPAVAWETLGARHVFSCDLLVNGHALARCSAPTIYSGAEWAYSVGRVPISVSSSSVCGMQSITYNPCLSLSILSQNSDPFPCSSSARMFW